MEVKPKHIVHKLSCEIKTSNSQTAQLFKDNLGDWLNNELLPLIEDYLDKMDDNAGLLHFQIPKLALTLQSPTPLFEGKRALLNLKSSDQLLHQARRQLEKQLRRLEQGLAEENLTDSQNRIIVNNQSSASAIYNNLDRKVNTIIYILTNGYKPWWLGNEEKAPLFFSDWEHKQAVNEILSHAEFRNFLKQAVRDPLLRKRLVYQFSFEQNQIIFDHYINSEFDVNLDNKLVKTLNKSLIKNLKIPVWSFLWTIDKDSDYRQGFLKLINSVFTKMISSSTDSKGEAQDFLKYALKLFGSINKKVTVQQVGSINDCVEKGEIISEKLFQRLLKSPEFNPDNLNGRSIEKDDSGKMESSPPSRKLDDPIQYFKDDNGQNNLDEGGMQVEQAGLILLHPFLKEFFLQTQLLNAQNEFVDVNRAVMLLHYLATKEELAFDHELIFEKFCCGLAVDTPIDREIKLTDIEKAQTEELLAEVIGHWKALKGTGTDTLRAEFLCRNGLLIFHGRYPKLVMERKTQDILLDKLPWGIGMARFPWKKELLFVEW